MSFTVELDRGLQALQGATADATGMLERLTAELTFAGKLAEAKAREDWQALVLQALTAAVEALKANAAISEVLAQAEATLAPLGATAKGYTVHCVGHAHIDMNWLWNWPETVATVNDTVTTVLKLMDEFPTFHFSQSQTSIYQIMKDYLPALFERVKQRVRDGRWEITASQWVEGEKNLASGEIISRHLLYTRRFVQQEFGLPYEAITIDWEPDTFGHPHTLPGLLARGGVKRYYFHRGNHQARLFWWQGKDGARVLAFDDWNRGYNGQILPNNMIAEIFSFEAATGLRDSLYVYGVGDHGGGPTRRDLVNAIKMDAWPIFPRIKLSTTEAFYTIAEQQAKDLPVQDAEMNYVVEGCYTAQTNIKRANRKSENALVEAEIWALLGSHLAGLPYPAEGLATGWRHAMFNQFHDILPGSGIHATYEYAQGLFQEIITLTSMAKTQALRAIAGLVNTAASCACVPPAEEEPGGNVGPGIGGGPGDYFADGAVTRYGMGGRCCDPFVIFNTTPWTRSEVVSARLWDHTYADNQVVVTDDAGQGSPAQVTGRGWHNGHQYLDVVFPAHHIPGLGYRSYSVARSVEPGTSGGCSGDGMGIIENEFLRVEVEEASGAIVHLIDKRTGADFVPAGERLGVLEYLREAPHPMTAWVIGQFVAQRRFTSGATLEFPQNGPYRAEIKVNYKYHDSTFTLTISLAAGVPRLDFALDVNWLERGSAEIGVPCLKIAFPVAVRDGVARYECANGDVIRSTNQRELPSYTFATLANWMSIPLHIQKYPVDVPGQKWIDLTGTHAATGEPAGVTLVNDSKYGFSIDGNVMRINLIRSSYDPDPLPELGRHVIAFALLPHLGAWSVAEATRAGYAFNYPLNVVGTTEQTGALPGSMGFGEILTPNVLLSGLKKAEDSDAVIIRLYETDGQATTAQMRLAAALVAANAPAVETDILEQPLPTSTARMAGDVLSVDIPPYGMVTVKIG